MAFVAFVAVAAQVAFAAVAVCFAALFAESAVLLPVELLAATATAAAAGAGERKADYLDCLESG